MYTQWRSKGRVGYSNTPLRNFCHMRVIELIFLLLNLFLSRLMKTDYTYLKYFNVKHYILTYIHRTKIINI